MRAAISGGRGVWSVGLALLLWGCAPENKPTPSVPERSVVSIDPAEVSGERALENVRALTALGLRDSGTPGAKRAAEWLSDRLRTVGVSARVDAFDDRWPNGTATFYNVIGEIPGRSDEWVVLGSHFDTKAGMPPAFEGANDSGSSTGLLLELARILQSHAPLEHPVMVAFFDGEECRVRYGPHDGLHGSRRLARQLTTGEWARPVKAMILMDMIGDRDLTVTLPRNGDGDLLMAVFNAAKAEGVRDRFRLFKGAILDDHVPFMERGIPAVNLIDFEYGSAPGLNDYWHTADDRMEHISAESLQMVGRVVVRVLNRRP